MVRHDGQNRPHYEPLMAAYATGKLAMAFDSFTLAGIVSSVPNLAQIGNDHS
jgi:hypothetical protein